MSKNENDPINPLFRKAANHYHVEFNEKDWLNLKERLDKEAGRYAAAKGSRRWKHSAAAAGVLLISSLLIMNSSDTQRQEKFTPKNAHITKESSAGITTDNTKDPGPLIRQDQKSEQQASFNHPSGKVNENKNEAIQEETTNDESSLNGKIEALDKAAPISSESKPGKLINRYAMLRLKSPTFYPLQANDSLIINHLSDKHIPGEPQAVKASTNDPEGKGTKPLYQWSIVMALAPDFSMIGLERYTSPRESFGMLIGYHLSDRFSVMAGLLKSSKKYWGYADEYNTPVGYWKNYTNGIVPEQINGTCNVLEIPLMVRYNLVGSVKFNVFVSAGVSSYLLTSEKYRYTFASPNPGSREGWSSDRDSRYLFNISNISVGYERFVLPNLAIGIEPYFKIPLSGMGWSDVNIFSTGAYLTIRYQLLKKEGRATKIREHPG